MKEVCRPSSPYRRTVYRGAWEILDFGGVYIIDVLVTLSLWYNMYVTANVV